MGSAAVGKGSGGGGRDGPGAAEVKGSKGRRGIVVVSLGSSCQEVTAKTKQRSQRLVRGRGRAPVRGMPWVRWPSLETRGDGWPPYVTQWEDGA